MKLKLSIMLSLATIATLFIGCGSSSSNDENIVESYTPKNIEIPSEIPQYIYQTKNGTYNLSVQSGTQNYLFYGDVNHKSLGRLNNVKVIDQNTTLLVDVNDTSDVDYAVPSTAMEYNITTKSYSNLYVKTLSYVSNGKAYIVNMEKNGTQPTPMQNSNSTSLSKADFTGIDYLGNTEYLIAHDDDSNKTVLITPDMNSTTQAIDFGDKKLLSVTYPSYGEDIDGYLVYNNETKKVQKCSTNMSCSDINIPDVGSRDFEDDIMGTTYSVFVIDNNIYRLDKNSSSITKITFTNTNIDRTYLNGESLYIVGDDHNIYNVDMLHSNTVKKITPNVDVNLERIRGFTNSFVIYGSDTYLMAVKKDGTSNAAKMLTRTTKLSGYKYVKDYGIGDNYLFVTYNIDMSTNDTSYSACIFDGNESKCIKNSFWAGATLKKSGERNFNSTFTYPAYSYIRVDNTDNYGGGTLKAIDPEHPFDDGKSMGTIAKYNFQTFLTNSRFRKTTIDNNGSVVFYAKNDVDFHVDAFYFNLLEENSLIQLNNIDPGTDVTSGRDHCNGRPCMLCHNLAAGKIYSDLKGANAVYGYKIQLEFENGIKTLADVSKGKGENFSTSLKNLVGKFKVNVLNEQNSTVLSSSGFSHEGVSAANCNFCHSRKGVVRFNAPGSISIKW